MVQEAPTPRHFHWAGGAMLTPVTPHTTQFFGILPLFEDYIIEKRTPKANALVGYPLPPVT